MPAEVDKTLALVRKDWAQLLEAEQAYAICPDYCTAVVAILRRLCLPIRDALLALGSCDYDLESDFGVEALLMLDAMLDILGDGKCIEDTHSHLRYLGAKAKNSISSRASRFHACITAKVLEGRGVNTIGLDDVKLALASWSSSFQPNQPLTKRLRQHQCQPH